MSNHKTINEVLIAQSQLSEAVKLLCKQFQDNTGLYPIIETVKTDVQSHAGILTSYDIHVSTTIKSND